MEKKQLAACLIVKDDSEEDALNRCLSTVAPHVDKVFITGTKNPQKRIKKLCKKYNAEWSWFPWVKDFSKARNFNFSQAKDYEWLLWCDADDVLAGGATLRQAIELAEQNNIKAVFAKYLYQVEVDKNGNLTEVLIEHLRERLIKNDGTYEWIAPIHETLIEKVPSGKTDFQGFYFIHLSDFNRMVDAMWRNIEILENEVIEKHHDPRPIYYLAKAYFDTKEPMLIYEPLGEGVESLTIELLKDYLRKSGWEEERAQAWEYLSMIYREMGSYKKAIACLLSSFEENPKFPSTYIQLALNYVMLKRWDYAMHWIKLAGQVDIPKTTLVVNPKDYKTMILECLYHVYLNTGKLEETLKVIQGLTQLLPNDLNKKRLQDIVDLKNRNDLAHWIVNTANYLRATKQFPKLKALVNAIPQEVASEPVFLNLKREVTPPKTWGENEIALWCGPGWEGWSPKSVAKGIGGSEEAVIYLMKELADLGWKVTVYGEPQDDEGEYDGVKYVPNYLMNWDDNFNIFISWRQPGVFDIPIKAKKTYLWLHDLQNALDYTEERVRKIDKVMFLSKFHRTNVPALPEEKIMYTTNGINI